MFIAQLLQKTEWAAADKRLFSDKAVDHYGWAALLQLMWLFLCLFCISFLFSVHQTSKFTTPEAMTCILVFNGYITSEPFFITRHFCFQNMNATISHNISNSLSLFAFFFFCIFYSSVVAQICPINKFNYGMDPLMRLAGRWDRWLAQKSHRKISDITEIRNSISSLVAFFICSSMLCWKHEILIFLWLQSS